MADTILSIEDQTDTLRRDERCRRQHVVRYRYTTQGHKRLRQQQIKEDLRGLRLPSMVCLAIGIVFTLGSIAMTVCGYCADSIATHDTYNGTVYVDEDLKEHLEDLKKIGPVLVGCGIFVSMCALVVFFETRNEKSVPKKKDLSCAGSFVEYSFGTRDHSNADDEFKQVNEFDLENRPQTSSMQYVNDRNTNSSTDLDVLRSELQLSEETNKQHNSFNCNLEETCNNNITVEENLKRVNDWRNQNEISTSSFPLLNNCATNVQLLPRLPVDIKRINHDEPTTVSHSGSEINRVMRGSQKLKQRRKHESLELTSDTQSNAKENNGDKNHIETENDTFNLIEEGGDVDQKKGKRKSLRGSMKRKKRSTIQPSDNAAFDVTHTEDNFGKIEKHIISRSQPSSSTFSRKFSNEAWVQSPNQVDGHGMKILNGAFRSESSLACPSTAQNSLVMDLEKINSTRTNNTNKRTKDQSVTEKVNVNVPI